MIRNLETVYPASICLNKKGERKWGKSQQIRQRFWEGGGL